MSARPEDTTSGPGPAAAPKSLGTDDSGRLPPSVRTDGPDTAGGSARKDGERGSQESTHQTKPGAERLLLPPGNKAIVTARLHPARHPPGHRNAAQEQPLPLREESPASRPPQGKQPLPPCTQNRSAPPPLRKTSHRSKTKVNFRDIGLQIAQLHRGSPSRAVGNEGRRRTEDCGTSAQRGGEEKAQSRISSRLQGLRRPLQKRRNTVRPPEGRFPGARGVVTGRLAIYERYRLRRKGRAVRRGASAASSRRGTEES
jgi:hypothetical protein